MMFMIPEVLVNFAIKNLLKMFWQRRSKSIKSINSLILKRQKSLRRKAILGRDSPWETTKFLNCPKIRMFRKDKQFLLHIWHPSCYSIKSFDQRKDRNQDQGNVLMAYKVVIRPYIFRRDTFCLTGSNFGNCVTKHLWPRVMPVFICLSSNL
jgi:hypothetical protein